MRRLYRGEKCGVIGGLEFTRIASVDGFVCAREILKFSGGLI